MKKSWVEITLRQDSYCRLCGKKMKRGEVVEWRPSMVASTLKVLSY